MAEPTRAQGNNSPHPQEPKRSAPVVEMAPPDRDRKNPIIEDGK